MLLDKYNNWDRDLKDSVKALEGIRCNILPKLISGKIYTIECQDNEVLMLLDQKSGIDYIRENKKGLQGIAARVQWGKNWDTFTIRTQRHTGTKTEYKKRLEQIKNGYFYPAFTLQAYFNNRNENKLLSIAIIRTLRLYKFIENNPVKIHYRKSDNNFIYVNWKDLNGLIETYFRDVG